MRTEARFLVAIVLMLGVLVGTNLLFPPVPPEEIEVPPGDAASPGQPAIVGVEPELPSTPGNGGTDLAGDSVPIAPAVERRSVVEGPLYRLVFSSVGARLVSAEMSGFRALNRDAVVDLIPAGADGYFGLQLLVGQDTVDLTSAPFVAEPQDGVLLNEGGRVRELQFVYQHPSHPLRVEVAYEFLPDEYFVRVRGRVSGVERATLITQFGDGLSFTEADSAGEARAMAYVSNHLRDGIRSSPLARSQPGVSDGPYLWTAFRSKFFVVGLFAGDTGTEGVTEPDYLGGLLVSPSRLPERVHVRATQSLSPDGSFAYRLYLGPQEYQRLQAMGQDFDEVNPYGWRVFRPIIRPFVGIITPVLVFLHTQLSLGYGWVLIVFGVLMRVVLWPLNHRAMKAQLKNMAVQPLFQEIQTKYKDNPERLQKEMMKLYKEHGFNPLAGCVPMLLPWPVLFALFFVFQSTIEFRGVPFLWLPDLSAPDPIYVLPVFMGATMFLMQWVTMRSVEQSNPQMKMMLWILPIMMVFLFFNLASGLNLYYATANIATIPQQIWIAKERKKMSAKTALKTAQTSAAKS